MSLFQISGHVRPALHSLSKSCTQLTGRSQTGTFPGTFWGMGSSVSPLRKEYWHPGQYQMAGKHTNFFRLSKQVSKQITHREWHSQVVCWVQLCPSCVLRGVRVTPKEFRGNGDVWGVLPRRAEQDLAEMGEVTKNRAGSGAQCGRGHITGGRCHLSHPVLSQTEELGPVFKPDLGLSSTPKLLHLERETGKDLTALSVRPRSAPQPNHPSVEEHHRFIPICTDIMKATQCQMRAAEEPWSGLHEPGCWEEHCTHSHCHGSHLLTWEHMFLGHHTLLAGCSRNEQQHKEWDFSVVYKTRRKKKQSQRNLWLIWYIQKRKSRKISPWQGL